MSPIINLMVMASVSLVAGPDRPAAEDPPGVLAPPVEDGPFLRPAVGGDAEPVWGVRGGIAVGLWPTPGPRGLIRVYAPYLGQPARRMINFIAVEPIVGRARGLSELEPSARDRVAGKAMWSGDDADGFAEPRSPWRPAAGRIAGEPGARTLTVHVFVERFDNGARPFVELTLREDRPHEVAFRTFAAPGGAAMRACVLTATMGNYARLRALRLGRETAKAGDLWPGAEPDRWGFLPHRSWSKDRMLIREGEAIAAAVPDEADPGSATYAAAVPGGWRYRGRTATQYWRAPDREGLVVRVNARTTYWATEAPIPGGVSFENFELEAPFEPGERSVFGVTPDGPESLGFRPPGD